MTKETMHKILDLYDQARQDAEYMALQEKYTPAQEAFAELWLHLPDVQQQIVGNYLSASVDLYHRLLDMALTTQKRTGSD